MPGRRRSTRACGDGGGVELSAWPPGQPGPKLGNRSGRGASPGLLRLPFATAGDFGICPVPWLGARLGEKSDSKEDKRGGSSSLAGPLGRPAGTPDVRYSRLQGGRRQRLHLQPCTID